ncbi:MAG: carbonic anhydrase [Kineosporiaceae bacterium]|jgi:carbonic anhydrase
MVAPDTGNVPDAELERLAGAGGPEAVRALRRLLDGNARFASGAAEHPAQDAARRREVVAGQHPWAMVLSCSDSRVPVELLFDTGIGDLFGMRVAGNILDDTVLGSIEYGAEHLHIPLLVVLGHSSCGAVAATAEAVRAGQDGDGHIAALVAGVREAIGGVLPEIPEGASLYPAEVANVHHVAARAVQRSAILREVAGHGALAVVGAYYDLDTGQVSLLG